MTKCKKCGREIEDGEKYCAACQELRDKKGKFWIKICTSVVAVTGVIGYGLWKHMSDGDSGSSDA